MTNLSVFGDLAGHVGGGRGQDGLFFFWNVSWGRREREKKEETGLSFFCFFSQLSFSARHRRRRCRRQKVLVLFARTKQPNGSRRPLLLPVATGQTHSSHAEAPHCAARRESRSATDRKVGSADEIFKTIKSTSRRRPTRAAGRGEVKKKKTVHWHAATLAFERLCTASAAPARHLQVSCVE